MVEDINPYSEFNIYRATSEFIDKLVILQRAVERGDRSAYGDKHDLKVKRVTDNLFSYLRMTLPPIETGYMTDRIRAHQIMVERYFNGRLPPYTAQILLKSLRPHLSSRFSSQVIRIELSNPYDRYVKTLRAYPLPRGVVDENLEWILKYIYPWESLSESLGGNGRMRGEFLRIVFGLPEVSPELLERLCYHEDLAIRLAASGNPNCPEEGKVIAALLSSPLPEMGSF